MKILRKTCLALTTACMLTTAAPVGAGAQPVHTFERTSYPEWDELDHAGHAYQAASYTPSMRPYLVVGLVLVVTALVVYFQNYRHHHHSH